MATLTPTITIKDPKLGHGGAGVPPPKTGGGDDGRGDNGAPDYGGRLRRARLGLITALVAIVMIFVALTSAYVIRQGLPVLDEKTGKSVSDWLQVNLPTQLLLINTFLLLLSSLTAEFARRQMTRLSRLAPVQSIPGISLGEEKNFPWLALTVILIGIPVRAVSRVARAGGQGVLSCDKSQQFVCLPADCGPRSSSDRRSTGFSLLRSHFPVSFSPGTATHCIRYFGLVLALHGAFVDLHFRLAGICTVEDLFFRRLKHV